MHINKKGIFVTDIENMTPEELIEAADNVIPMVAPAPKDPTPPSENWLAKLPEGMTFVTQAKDPRSNFGLVQFIIIRQLDLATLLLDNLNAIDDEDGTYHWVASQGFSDSMVNMGTVAVAA